MKSFYTLAVAGLVAVASAQLDSLPSCALKCLTGGLSSTGCSITDFKCACSNTAFVASSTKCIQSGCSADEQQAALEGAVALCKSAGVDISVPSPGSGASSTAAPSSSAAPSAPASSSASASAPAASSSAPLESIPSVAPTASASASVTKSTVAVPAPTSGNSTGNGSYVPPQGTAPESGSGRLSAGLSAVVLAVAAVLAF